MDRKLQVALIPVGIAAAVACAAVTLWVRPVYIGLALAGVCLLSILFALLYLRTAAKRACEQMDDIFRKNSSAAAEILTKVNIPSLVFGEDGRIVWRNAAFADMYEGKDIKKVFKDAPAVREGAFNMDFNGRSFQVIGVPVDRERVWARKLTFQYWIDRTEALHYSRLYEEQMPTVALIYVDNYEELNADKQFHKNAVLSEVEKLVSGFVSGIDGSYRRYDSSKFFVVFEAKRIEELEKARFPLLDAAREIATGTDQTVTLSISVGAANRVAQSDEFARQGMELALGRGGDQAIVKRGSQYTFFGGRRQVASKNSRVRARLFAKALRQLMENADAVFIMGHIQPDMDCVGAALGLMRCADTVGCRSYLVLDETNSMIESALTAMQKNSAYHDRIKTPEQAEALMRPGGAVIVVDTQREGSVTAPELYYKAGKTVLIDHHRRNVDSLPNPTLNYLEAGASSTCEMVTEVLQYFDDSISPTGFESCALLAGITLDTKHFAFNTGARTFEAASYLRRNGADNSMVKRMFQDDMQTYRARADVVESAMLMEKGIAVSTCTEDIENGALIAAQAADELISIRGIRASFVLAERSGAVSISGRSLGDVNVQVILERLGGGGHLTVAGAQLPGASIEDAMSRLTDSIKIYLKEADTQ